MRRSVVSRERQPKASLLRIALGPDRCPFVDLLGRAPGRGVYVEPNRGALEEILSPKGLERAFKGAAAPLEASAIQRTIDDTVARIEDRILELVSLARRAGKLDMGMDSVLRAAQRGERGLVLVLAADLSERSASMIPDITEGSLVRVATKAVLGARLGRDEIGVVAIHPSAVAERVSLEATRRDGLLSASTNVASRGRVRSARKREQD